MCRVNPFPAQCEKISFLEKYTKTKGVRKMGRAQSTAFTYIRAMCGAHKLDCTKLLTKAKLLLNCYRRVCWDTTGRCEPFDEDPGCCRDGDLLEALDYLLQFDPDAGSEIFENTIHSLFESRWMIDLVDHAMVRVKEFPDQGDTYFEILSKCYLTRFKYSEREILEILNLERSRYYDRKKEAMMVFGISLWGKEIPKLKRFLEGRDTEALPAMA